MADICRKCDEEEGRTVFVIGAYGIGKERAFLGTARALGWKIWCDPQKVATMRMLQLGDSSMSLLTEVASPFRPAAALVPLTCTFTHTGMPCLATQFPIMCGFMVSHLSDTLFSAFPGNFTSDHCQDPKGPASGCTITCGSITGGSVDAFGLGRCRTRRRRGFM